MRRFRGCAWCYCRANVVGAMAGSARWPQGWHSREGCGRSCGVLRLGVWRGFLASHRCQLPQELA